MRTVMSFALLLLSCGGMAIARHLTLEHAELYESGVVEGLLCSPGGRWSCGDVLAHDSAWLFGLPVSAWGLLFYIVVFALVVGNAVFRGATRVGFLKAGVLLVGLGVLFDAYLGSVMLFALQGLCPWCLASYGINLGLLVGFWLLLRAASIRGRLRDVLPSFRALDEAGYYRTVVQLGLALVTLAAAASALTTTLEPLVRVQRQGLEQAETFLGLLVDGRPDVDMSLFEGQPTIGPADAPIHVLVAGDFQCRYCRITERKLNELRARFPEDLRLTFLNSPVNSDCNPSVPTRMHEHACWLARAAECAEEQERFWPFQEAVLTRFDPERLVPADVLGLLPELGIDEPRFRICVDGEEAARRVAEDVALCKQAAIVSTPSLVINGVSKRGGFYPEVLEAVIVYLRDQLRGGNLDSDPH